MTEDDRKRMAQDQWVAHQLAPAVPPAVGEFAVEERQRLLDTIEEQAREIEALKDDVSRLRSKNATFSAAWDELAAMKVQPSGVVLPERMQYARYFRGVVPENRREAEAHTDGWNACLDEVARLNSSPVSAGEAVVDLDAVAWAQIKEAASQSAWIPEQYFMNDWVSDVCTFLRDPRPVSASGVDERAAFEAAMRLHHAGDMRHLEARTNDGYYVHHIQELWLIWQARAALTAPAPSHSEQVRHMVPVCTTCNGVGIVGHSTLCPECAAAPSAGSQGGDV